jgi:hypothetical protein
MLKCFLKSKHPSLSVRRVCEEGEKSLGKIEAKKKLKILFSFSSSEKPKWWKDEDSLSYIVNIYGAILSLNVNVNEQNFFFRLKF